MTYNELKELEVFNELQVDMNYKTGSKSENNCRIVTAGSELDLMYKNAYREYKKKKHLEDINRRLEEYDKEFGEQERKEYQERKELRESLNY